ncbi:MAG TPA: hypothetical protein VGI70_19140, partial [Polyangiales bacterium]
MRPILEIVERRLVRLKEKLQRRLFGCVVVCVLVSAGPARAAPVLLLEERADANRGFASALRIQLVDTPLREEVWTPAAATAERVRAATELGVAADAIATVWTERPTELRDGSIETLLYVVTQRGNRALLELVRVPGDHGPEIDRVLALKVSELVQALQRREPIDLLRATQPPSAASIPPPSAASLALETPVWGAFAQAGPRFIDALGWTRWGVGAELGPTWQRARWLAAISCGLEAYPSASKLRDRTRIDVASIAPRVLARGRWRASAWTLDLHGGLGLELLSVEGVTALGTRGSAHTRTVSGLLGIEVEREIVRRFGIAALFDLQLDAHRQRFEIDEMPVADLGRLSGGAALMFV